MRTFWSNFVRWCRYQAISLFRVDDGSERVARGFTVGALINFFPTFGFGVLVSGFVAGLVRGNVLAGFVGGALFAILWPILFYLNMQVGEIFYRSPILVDELEDVTDSTIDALVKGKTFLAGAAVNSLIAGLVLYLAVYLAHRCFRENALAWLGKFRKARNRSPET